MHIISYILEVFFILFFGEVVLQLGPDRVGTHEVLNEEKKRKEKTF